MCVQGGQKLIISTSSVNLFIECLNLATFKY